MNIDNDENLIREKYGNLLSGMEKLSNALDRQEYPGAAWPASKKRRTLPIFKLVTESAAAAVIVLAIGLVYMLTSSKSQSNHVGASSNGSDAIAAMDETINESMSYELISLDLLLEEKGGIVSYALSKDSPSNEEWVNPDLPVESYFDSLDG